VDPLISVDDLAARQGDPSLVLLDVRWRLDRPDGRPDFQAGHIPGAVFVDLETELAAPPSPADGRHPLPDPADLQAAARRWGIGAGDTVVAYDDLGGMSAARAWWLLADAGVDVRLLDGGLAAWRDAGLPLEAGERTPEPGDVVLSPGRLPVVDQTELEPFGGVLLDALERERTTARAAMLEALTAPRYFGLLERLAETVSAPLPTPAPGDAPQPALVDLVRAEARKLRSAVKKAGDDPPDEVLHALRIRGKRVRYTGELVAPSLRGTPAGKQVKRLLSATTALQEVLGDHQDACVAEQRIRGLLAGLDVTPDTVFVAGRLVERETHRAAEKRREWRGAWVLVDARIAEV